MIVRNNTELNNIEFIALERPPNNIELTDNEVMPYLVLTPF